MLLPATPVNNDPKDLFNSFTGCQKAKNTFLHKARIASIKKILDTTQKPSECVLKVLMQSAQYQVDHGDMNKRLGRSGMDLIVFAQPMVSVKPDECVLDDPSVWGATQSLGLVRAKHHLQSKKKPRGHPQSSRLPR